MGGKTMLLPSGSDAISIEIDCGGVKNISIRYTMNNSFPTLESPEYTGPIRYDAQMGGALKVIACDLNHDNKGAYKYFSRMSTASLPCSPWAS